MRDTRYDNEPWTISKADGNNGFTEEYEFDNKREALAAIKELESGVPESSGFNACPTSQHKPSQPR